MHIRKALILFFSLVGLSACSLLSRDPRSGYAEDFEQPNSAVDFYQQRQQKTEVDAREELGLGSHPLSDNERNAVEDRVHLKRLESQIATKREKRQYYSVRAALRSDRERIYFLSLPSFETRERWIHSRGAGLTEESYPDEVAKVIENNDIALGMTQKTVSQSWGDPDAVEVAGDPIYGYQCWRYNRYVSGNEGYQQEQRIVYFEGGRVVGWERP